MKHNKILILFVLLTNILFGVKTEIMQYEIYPTDNFDVYFSKQELKSILPEIEYILEEAFKNNTEYFDVKFDYKIPFFVYYGYQQFLQNTIVDVSENTGGVTEAFKNRFLVPYTGSRKFLQHVINHEFVHEVEYNILYSGIWRTPLLLKSIFYPNWLMEGLAEYRSSIFNKTQQEMLVRDMAVSDKLIPLEHLHNFAHLKPHMVLPAYEESAKLCEFIEKEYGKKQLVSILKLYRERFDPNSVLNTAIKNKLSTLQQKFFEELKTYYTYEVEINSMTHLDKNKKISYDSVYPVHYYSAVVYRDNLIYLSDIEGKLFFYIFTQNKQKMLIPKGLLERNVDVIFVDHSRVSISDNGILCFAGLKNNEGYIYLYNIKNKKINRIKTKNVVDLLVSSYISNDGNFVYFCGVKNCKSVIYKYNINNRQLTKLKEDENFISQLCVNTNKILYVKELPCKKYNINTWQNDIFMYDTETGLEQQLTFTLSDEFFPCFLDENNILFISDYDKNYNEKLYGVKNLYMCNINNYQEILQLTNVIGGINYVYCSPQKKIFLLYYSQFNQHIYEYLVDELTTPKVVYTTTSVVTTADYKFSSVLRKSSPYKFLFSTDLFFPIIYFSTDEGLLTLFYWQASDMVGEHSVALSSIVLGDKNYNVNLQYRFLKLPPAITVNVTAESLYNYVEQVLNKYIETDVLLSYDISRLATVNLMLGYSVIDKEYFLVPHKKTKFENFVYISYMRNSIIGKFLEPLRGSYHEVAFKVSDRFYNGNFLYNIFYYFMTSYIHLGKEHSLFNRLEIIYSSGRDKKKFYLGGPERISGIWYDDIVSSFGCFYRIGWRFPIVYDINYYMWYLFPDFFFKGLYGEAFVDIGFDEKIQTYSSLGLKFKLYSFVMQMFVFKFELIFGKQFDINKPLYVYFNLTGGI